ncbi:hypothetical protein QBC43DRAFT_318827 [Cladorrhinum sp. PSN259]|nr:hypothetical protein QBC43DRAFT_318827 [Cladorrhinum sp. PSN259]
MLSCCFGLGRNACEEAQPPEPPQGDQPPEDLASGELKSDGNKPSRDDNLRKSNSVDQPAGDAGDTFENPSPSEDSREGLIPLKGFDDSTGSKPRVDVIAIHGLNGHPIRTWKEDNVIWFAKFLPSTLPELDLRISTFGYNSQVLGGGSVLRVRDFATQLLASLHGRRSETSTERVPLVFICHSLGGIVFKKMITIAHERQSLYSSVIDSSKGVAFFGTPHCGSNVANASRVVRDIISFCTAGTFRADLLRNLERSSDELVEIAAQFVERAVRLHIVTVYEGRSVGAAVGPVVVGRGSAVLNLPNEHLIPIDADHRAICRFANQYDARFESILPTIRNMIRESIVVEDTDIKACLDTLYFPEYRARRSNVSQAHHSTFDWIWKHPKYRQWENSRASSLIWLQGKPGSGKSTLANFVRSRVGSRVGSSTSGRQTVVVDFFYSARGGSRQNLHPWMLKSMLYQFLLQVPGLWGNYRKDFRDRRLKDKGGFDLTTPKDGQAFWDFSTMKTLLASLGSIHSPNLRLTAYVLVDALDESAENQRQDIIELLCLIARRDSAWPVNFRVFLTSRPSPKFEHAFRDFDTIILENETASDIVNYVYCETRRIAEDILRCDAKQLDFISTYLIKASDGVFLWVKLVLDQLDERATDGFCSVAELEQLLLSIPRDLRELYRLIIDKINNGSQSNVAECQTVFRWIAYSSVPLQIEQVLEVVAARTCSASGSSITRTGLQRHRVGNTEVMRRRLISLCGNLVEVKGPVVQFIHTTVREFLMEEACTPPISLAEGVSLDEMAFLCADYLDAFSETLQEAPLLSTLDLGNCQEAGWADPDGSVLEEYISTMEEFSILKLIFQYRDDALFSNSGQLQPFKSSSLKIQTAVSKVVESMKPLVLEALARGHTGFLESLIIHKDQINCLYPIPKHDPRFNQQLTCSPIVVGNLDKIGLVQLVCLSKLRSNDRRQILELLSARGADVNFQDLSGSTPLHTAIRIRRRTRNQLSDTVENMVALHLNNGVLGLDEFSLKLYEAILIRFKHSTRLADTTLKEFRKVFVLLSSIMRDGYDLFREQTPGLKITRKYLDYEIPRYRPGNLGPEMEIQHCTVQSLLLTLKSLQHKLVKDMCDQFFPGRVFMGQKMTEPFWLGHHLRFEDLDCQAKHVQPLLAAFRSSLAAFLEHYSLPTDLIAYGANLRMEDKQQQTPIRIALELKHGAQLNIMLLCVKFQVDRLLANAKSKTEKEKIIAREEASLAELAYTGVALYDSYDVSDWVISANKHDSKFPFSIQMFQRHKNPSIYNTKHITGGTLLHVAAAKAEDAQVAKLLEGGISKDVLDDRGRTAKDIARELGHARVIESIAEYEEAIAESESDKGEPRPVIRLSRTEWSWEERRYVFVD